MKNLSEFPELWAWYEQSKSLDLSRDISSRLIKDVCEVLLCENDLRIKLWVDGLTRFFAQCSDGCEEFLAVQQQLQALGLDFLHLASELAEYALHCNQGALMLSLMRSIADQSGLAVFRFLSAWVALNLDQLNECVKECEKIDQPFACVYTVQGQAYLELGQLDDAIEALEVATKLDPREVLGFFQLARAYHLRGQYEKAWEALDDCSRIVHTHPEVAIMRGFVALASEQPGGVRSRQAFEEIMNTHDQIHHGALFGLLFDLVGQLQTADYFIEVLKRACWSDLKQDPEFYQKIPGVLRRLDQLGWKTETQKFLNLVA